MAPILLPIISSAISFASYDYETQELVIELRDGTVAVYVVSPATVAALVSAASPGRFYNEFIRSKA